MDYGARFGYESYNQCGTFIDDVAVGEGYYYDKYILDSMVGGCRYVNETRYDSGELVLLRDS